MNISIEAQTKWLGTMAKYEGFPLALRVNATAETSQNKKAYQKLVVITLELEKVLPSGLPEATYNDSLIDLDLEITSLFETNSQGVTALIETFGGKRNYYIYVSNTADVESDLNKLKTKHHQHKLSLFTKADPNWDLITNYKKDYPW